MHPVRFDHSGDSRLRFVFDDAVVSFGLTAGATFEEVAQLLGELSNRRDGHPVAIDVTLGSSKGDPLRPRSSLRLGTGIPIPISPLLIQSIVAGR